MAPLFEARSIYFETHSVFLDASNTPLPLAFDTYRLGGNVLHVRGLCLSFPPLQVLQSNMQLRNVDTVC